MDRMMDVDMTLMEEFPYSGKFYEVVVNDKNLPLIEQETVEVEVLSVKCDIQQASILGNAGFKTNTHNIYFMFEGILPIKRGMFFRGVAYGYEVDGVVDGVGFSQVGFNGQKGCVCQIKDFTE